MYVPQFRDDPNDPNEPMVAQLAAAPQGDSKTLDPSNPGELQPNGNYANPTYCLKIASAQELAAMVPTLVTAIEYHDPEDIGNDPAIQPPGAPATAGNPFNAWAAKVPWFRLQNGAIVNAVLVADYFTHGYPEATAVENATKEIAGVMQAWDSAKGSN